MESEKVKEIKKALENCQKNNCSDCHYFIDKKRCIYNLLIDTITLINELEKENAKLLDSVDEDRIHELGYVKLNKDEIVISVEKYKQIYNGIYNDIYLKLVESIFSNIDWNKDIFKFKNGVLRLVKDYELIDE